MGGYACYEKSSKITISDLYYDGTATFNLCRATVKLTVNLPYLPLIMTVTTTDSIVATITLPEDINSGIGVSTGITTQISNIFSSVAITNYPIYATSTVTSTILAFSEDLSSLYLIIVQAIAFAGATYYSTDTCTDSRSKESTTVLDTLCGLDVNIFRYVPDV